MQNSRYIKVYSEEEENKTKVLVKVSYIVWLRVDTSFKVPYPIQFQNVKGLYN